MRVAVVGLGAIGSQVLWQLSLRDGVEVHGFDTAYPGHPTAGAGGDSRLFWNLELAEPEYVPLIRRAATLWDELEEASEATLRDRTGVLVYGAAGRPQMERAVSSADPVHAPIEVLDASQLRSRFPQLRFGDHEVGAWDIRGAVIRPERTVAATADLARQRGAQVHEFDTVRQVVSRRDGVELVLNDRSERFDRAVVACGGWTPQLLPEVRDEVVAKRLTSMWFAAGDGADLEGVPPFLRTAPDYCYGIPSRDRRTVKVGLGFNDHASTGDPDALERHLSGRGLEQQIERFSWIQQTMLPSLHTRPERVGTYVESYTRSMMEHVKKHPSDDSILVMTGFSGHGFRVAPAMGEVGAQLILDGTSDVDVDFLAQSAAVFDIVDVEGGITTHNALMANAGAMSAVGAAGMCRRDEVR